MFEYYTSAALAAYAGKPVYYVRKNEEKPNHVISGRIWSSDKNSPLKQTIYIYGQGIFQRHYLDVCETDKDGNFNRPIKWSRNFWDFRQLHLILVIMKHAYPFAEHGVFLPTKTEKIQEINVYAKSSVYEIDGGDHEITFGSSPLDLKQVSPPMPFQIPSPDYFFRFTKALLPALIKRTVANTLSPFISTRTAQRIFDLFGQYEKFPNTPETLIHCLMNTVCAVPYEIQKDGRILWEALWDTSPLTGKPLAFDKEDALPNARVYAIQNEDKQVKLQSIEIKFRSDSDWKVITMLDQEDLEWAIYVAKGAFAVAGEATKHLGEGHLVLGVIGEAFFKCISKKNPLYKILAPHFEDTAFINWLGSKGIIFGQGSVLEKLTALTADSLNDILVHTVKERINYMRKDSIQESLGEKHEKAIAEKHHMYVLDLYANKVWDEDGEEISKYWHEIYQWSKSIYKRCNSFPKITKSKEGPQEGDAKKLKIFLGDMIWLATIGHGYIHAHQQVIANVFSASMGMNRRALKKDGSFALDGNTTILDLTFADFLTSALTDFGTKNINNSKVDSRLRALIEANKEGYPKGVLEMMPSSVQI